MVTEAGDGRQMQKYRTDIAWSTPDSITVYGLSLPDDVIGKVSFGDMAFLEIRKRLPTPAESTLFNAMLVTLVEHGLTPSTIAARMTYLGAPEAMQAAVAAGLSGLGSVFVGSVEGTARMLYELLPQPDASADLKALGKAEIARQKERRSIVPGIGHPFHKPIDPRTPVLLKLAEETGFSGRYVELIQHIAAAAEKEKGAPLPVNATGVLGALCCEMGLDWRVCRGLGVMARAVGLVGHILEEASNPLARDLWIDAERMATEHFRSA